MGNAFPPPDVIPYSRKDAPINTEHPETIGVEVKYFSVETNGTGPQIPMQPKPNPGSNNENIIQPLANANPPAKPKKIKGMQMDSVYIGFKYVK